MSIRKLSFSFFIVLISLISTKAQTPSPTPRPDSDVVRISTSLVQLDVTVVDAKGKVVTDLKPDEIEIYENGQKQKIKGLTFVSAKRTDTANTAKAVDPVGTPVQVVPIRAADVRRTIALVVDDLTLSFDSVADMRRALRKFVDEQMEDGDLVSIIRNSSGSGTLQQFTSNKDMLRAAIESLRWNPIGNGGIGAFAPLQPDFGEMTSAAGGDVGPKGAGNAALVQESFENFQTSTFVRGTLGALRYIVSGMSELPGRKSVVLFSDGWEIFDLDEHGFTVSGSVTAYLKRLVDLANRSSVVFYTIDARGLQYTGFTAADKVPLNPKDFSAKLWERSDKLLKTQDGISFLAKQTGGLVYKNRNDLDTGIRIALEDQSYYLVGYEPDSDTFDPKSLRYNRIEIKLKRPGLTARHRIGFINRPNELMAKPKLATDTAGLRMLDALTSPFAANEISLRMSALFGSNDGGSFVRSLLHVQASDLKFKDESDGSRTASFDVWAASFGDNGAPVDQIQKQYSINIKPNRFQEVLKDGFVYFFEFPVKKAGGYQYRVAIRDSQGGKIGSANQFVQIPDLKKGRLTTSGIVIESRSAEEWAKLFDPNAVSLASTAQTDTALRRVQLGTLLRYGIEVYNAKLDGMKKPALQTKIRIFRDGKLVLDGQAIPADLAGQTDMQRIQVAGAIDLGEKILPGDYILQIVVTDTLAKQNQQVTSQHIQFEVVR